jgi:hypothetical protein
VVRALYAIGESLLFWDDRAVSAKIDARAGNRSG